MPLLTARKGLLRPPSRQAFRAADIVIAIYGQSNAQGISTTGSSPPAASSGTFFFDGRAWGSVPNANGVREMLNSIRATTGRTVGALSGARSGLPIEALVKGNSGRYYDELLRQIMRSGGYCDFIVWYQGEGDAAGLTTKAAYHGFLSRLHGELCTDLNLSKRQCPLVLCGLGRVTADYTEAGWDSMQRTLLDAPVLPYVYYSHSNRDTTMIDSVHLDGASQGRGGLRFAKSITEILAGTTNFPNWHIVSSAVVDDTTTTIDVLHGLGTDFGPASGITGFEASGDNGASWVACTGVRTNSTRITATHSSLVVTSARKLRYQFGRNPDVSGAVVDNSTLSLPLDNSAGNLSPTPLTVLPVVTFASAAQNVGSGITQTRTGVEVPGASQSLLALIGLSAAAQVRGSTCSVTAQPSGTVISALLVDTNALSSDRLAAIFQAVLPSGTTSIDFSVTYNTAPFTTTRSMVSTIPAADLTSTTPVGSGKAASGSALSVSCDLPTSIGGCIFAVAVNESTAGGNTAVFSGTDPFATRNSIVAQGGTMGVGDSCAATTTTSTATATWNSADFNSICAASWR